MANTDGEAQIRAIADEIMSYLQDHPHAADDLGGVAQWWLVRWGYAPPPGKVAEALELLLAKNLITKEITAGGRSIYRRAHIFPPGQS
jgi:hypothetical protein